MVEQMTSVGMVALGALGALEIGGSSVVPIGVAVGALFVVWRASGHYQRLNDKVDNLAELIRSRPCIMPNGSCAVKPKEKEQDQ